MANVRQADHDGPAGLEHFDGSIEDSPRLNEVLENVRGHDAVEPAQGRQHVVPMRQVIQVEAMNFVQPLPSIVCVRRLKLDSHGGPNSILTLEGPPQCAG